MPAPKGGGGTIPGYEFLNSWLRMNACCGSAAFRNGFILGAAVACVLLKDDCLSRFDCSDLFAPFVEAPAADDLE